MSYEEDQLRSTVRDAYRKAATGESSPCAPGCCGPRPADSLALGYAETDLDAVPEGANLGLGCGNPQAIAALVAGETVLDLGAGAGFDCFLAARQVGPTGHVVGVDMTPEMVSKARHNAQTLGLTQVEFRLGEIEHLPAADSSIDAILSNCVVNLSPNKAAVFAEAWRVLRPGGRLAICDVVATSPLPEHLKQDAQALCGCIAGAARIEDLHATLSAAGFAAIRIDVRPGSAAFIKDWLPGSGVERYVVSAVIQGVKPPAHDAQQPSGAPEQ